jgi:hypothetical protein
MSYEMVVPLNFMTLKNMFRILLGSHFIWHYCSQTQSLWQVVSAFMVTSLIAPLLLTGPIQWLTSLFMKKEVQINNIHVYRFSLSIIPDSIDCATKSLYCLYLIFSSFSTFIFISWDVILSVDYSSGVTYFKRTTYFCPIIFFSTNDFLRSLKVVVIETARHLCEENWN